MDRRQKLWGLLGTLLICALMAGAAVTGISAAIGLSGCAVQAYLGALIVAAVCAAFGWSAPMGIAAAALATVAAGGFIASGISAGLIDALKEGVDQLRATGDASALMPGAPYLAGAAAAILAGIFYVFISDRSAITTAFAVALCLAAALIPAAMTGRASAAAIAPALVASFSAIAHTAEQRNTGGHIMAFIPALAAVALAFAIAPNEGVTWAPLERAADRVREIYEDYFNYTKERVAFSIAEQGYDYFGLHDDTPTHMLGGPADPDTGAVMLVETQSDLLLRGTVRGDYTGYSWEDDAPKARNLYYDFTRRARRNSTFGIDLMEKIGDSEAFEKVSASVTLVSDGSSTLFAPVRLDDFDMSLINAVYYNSVGELFLARDVEKGDSYAFTAWEVADYSALSAIERVQDDPGYDKARAEYLQLPSGIEEGVYSIAEALTQDCATDIEKVQAIMDGLAANCTYRLDVEYPPVGRDFVSYFLLDSREGYCSYFASAMAVLCRMADIPARYVEGFRVYAEPDNVTTVTGEEAHAWVEVYFEGIGWVAYDPTPGADNGLEDPAAPVDGDQGADVTPEPSPSPDFGEGATPTPQVSQEPTPPAESTPEPSDAPQDEPTPQNSAQPPVAPSAPPNSAPGERTLSGKIFGIIALILLLAALIAGAWLWLKKRLKKTDPIYAAAARESDDEAILVLYRALLTLLAQLGQAPLSGETPEAFALRLSRSGLDNPDFVEFARQVTIVRYSGAHATRELTALGNSAYLRFRRQMKKSERIKFDISRALRGLGDFEAIP